MRVSKKSTLSPVGMPFARKSKIFGLHSLLLRYPKKIYALSAYFFRPRRHNKLFYSATGGNRLLSSANNHPCDLENPLNKRVLAYKVFFRRTCRRKNKIRLTATKKLNLRFIDRLPVLPKAGSTVFLYMIWFYLNSVRRITAYEPIPKTTPITRNERTGKNRLVVPSPINPIAFIINSQVLLTSSSGNTN